MTTATPVITTFMSKRREKCPHCKREVAVRSDGRYEFHNEVKGVAGECQLSRKPSGRKDVRKPDKKDRLAMLKIVNTERRGPPVYFIWRCRHTWAEGTTIHWCGAKSTNAYDTPEKAQKAAKSHQKRTGHPMPEIEPIGPRKR